MTNHFTGKELLGAICLYLFFAISVFLSRNEKLYGDNAIFAEAPIEIFIYERTNLTGLADQFKQVGIEFNKDQMIWAGQTLRWRSFLPGRYLIEGKRSYADIFSMMAKGLQDPVRVTILPGVDKARLARSLSAQLRADSLDFIQQFDDSSTVALDLVMSGEALFSRMLPNTYEFFWTSSPENTVRRLYREFDRAVTQRYEAEIQNQDLSLEEIIILASIVEWEARVDEEKPRVSGLYLNRLNRNMMLQADPTVIYALGERRRLLFADYEVEHPYNTYRIRGLPPGPITNPSLSSIQAVLQPEEHDYLFMVATPEGTHRFTRTYREHQQASEEWRRWLREQIRIRDQLEANDQ